MVAFNESGKYEFKSEVVVPNSDGANGNPDIGLIDALVSAVGSLLFSVPVSVAVSVLITILGKVIASMRHDNLSGTKPNGEYIDKLILEAYDSISRMVVEHINTPLPPPDNPDCTVDLGPTIDPNNN